MKGTIRTIVIAAALAVSGDALAAGDRFARDLDLLIERDARAAPPGHRGVSDAPRSSSETAIFASLMIRLYQATLSAQDGRTCNFTPSCSRFTLEAIRRGGIARGSLLGADRLMRCHRFSKGQRLLDPSRKGEPSRGPADGGIADPVDVYIR